MCTLWRQGSHGPGLVPSWLMEHSHCLPLCDKWPSVGGESALEHGKPWLGCPAWDSPRSQGFICAEPLIMGAQTVVFDFLRRRCRTAPRAQPQWPRHTVTTPAGSWGKPCWPQGPKTGACHGVSLGQVA